MPRQYPSARDKLLDATERVILRDGPRGVSVDAVLRESGLSKGGFFHHFPSKEALLGALLERLSAAVQEQVARSSASELAGPARNLRAQVALAFDMPRAERERTRALVLALLTALLEAPSVAERARRANEVELQKALADGVELGSALLVQLALDGYFLSESFGTLELNAERRAALRAALLRSLETAASGRRPGEA